MKYLFICLLFCIPFHASSQGLLDSAEACLNRGDIQQYLHLIKAAEEDYEKHPSWCGNGQETWHNAVYRLKAIYYYKTGKTDTAIQILLPHSINRGLMGENGSMITTLKTILLNKYTEAQIRDNVMKSVNTIKTNPNRKEDYIIELFGHDVPLYSMDPIEYFHYKNGLQKTDLEKLDSLMEVKIPPADMQAMIKTEYERSFFYKTMTEK